MSGNGSRKPPRPQIEMLSSAEPEEAIAVIAAVEQFLADTALAPQPSRSVNPWQRAALFEGVSSTQAFGPIGPERRDTWQ